MPLLCFEFFPMAEGGIRSGATSDGPPRMLSSTCAVCRVVAKSGAADDTLTAEDRADRRSSLEESPGRVQGGASCGLFAVWCPGHRLQASGSEFALEGRPTGATWVALEEYVFTMARHEVVVVEKDPLDLTGRP